jgi:hypothetical protein
MAGIGLGIAACGFCLGVGISRLGLGISRSGEHIATGIENGLKGHGSQTIAQVHGYFGAHEVMNERLQKLLDSSEALAKALREQHACPECGKKT